MQFPRLVYKSASTYELVQDAASFSAALGMGFFASVPEAIAGNPEAKDDAPPTREELEAKANDLELKFDGRTSDAKLSKMIEETLKA